MAEKNDKTRAAVAGAVVTGLVVSAGYGGYELHKWSAQWDRAAEKAAGSTDPNGGSGTAIAPELLTWRETARIPTGLASVKSFALLKDGTLVVAGERKLRLLSPTGTVLRDIPLDGMPQAVAALETPAGITLFAGMKDHIEIYDNNGHHIDTWKSMGDGAFLTCLTPGAAGATLWAADAGRRVVVELDLTGKVLREVGREDAATHAPGLVVPSAHLDVAVGVDGLIWVNNPGRHELEAFDQQGVMVRQWGEGGAGIGRFSGCCNPTDFFMMPDGRVVTAEKGTPRVKVFDQKGVLLSIVSTQFAPEAAGIDIECDPLGRVFVLDPVGKEVHIYTQTEGK
jgi:hypothetical protein